MGYNDNSLDVEADAQQIWYDSHVKVQRKVTFIDSWWYNAGIRCIGDLKDQNAILFFILQWYHIEIHG